MNILEVDVITNDPALSGLFRNNGCGIFYGGTCTKVERQKAEDNIDRIKSDEGFNDLVYMKPEQAGRSLNKIIERLNYEIAKSKREEKQSKSRKSIEGYREAARIYGKAIGEVLSQFRQYALGMDGEIQKLGTNKKELNGIAFETPFYRLILPHKVAGTKPLDSISKDELLNMMSRNITGNKPTEIPAKNNTAMYIGIGVGVLAVTGGLIYSLKKKKH